MFIPTPLIKMIGTKGGKDILQNLPVRDQIHDVLQWLGRRGRSYPVSELKSVELYPHGIPDEPFAAGAYPHKSGLIQVTPVENLPEIVFHEFQHFFDDKFMGGLDDELMKVGERFEFKHPYWLRPAERRAWPYGRMMGSLYDAEKKGQPWLFPEDEVTNVIRDDTWNYMDREAELDALQNALLNRGNLRSVAETKFRRREPAQLSLLSELLGVPF